MDKDTILELRSLFEKRMQEEDFCIGEEQVNKLFREVLGEPEPVREPIIKEPQEVARTREILAVAMETFVRDGLKTFEQDNPFYSTIKNKR